jgi:hypothetical protein
LPPQLACGPLRKSVLRVDKAAVGKDITHSQMGNIRWDNWRPKSRIGEE